MRNHVLRLLFYVAVGSPATAAAQALSDLARQNKTVTGESAGAADARPGARPRLQTPAQQAAQSLNPDISVIGELLTDLSNGTPRFTTEGDRFEVREVEVGIQAAVDPFFRADFFIGFHPDGAEIEEAYVTALSLPGGLQAKLGQFRVPINKVNLIHRPELITVDYPLMIRDFFGEEGLASPGVSLSRIFAPFGFFQEIIVYGIGRLTGHEHEHEEEVLEFIEAVDRDRLRNQVAFGGQLRNFYDVTPATNLELGFSAVTGRVREFDPDCEVIDPCPPIIPTEVFENQSFYGAYFTVRWRPPQRALYRSFIWNNEFLINSGHHGSRAGAFSQAQYQLTRRTFLGARFDAVELADELLLDDDSEWLTALSGYLTVFPSEFSRFKLGLERTFGGSEFGDQWRSVLQTTFAIGPHRPHAF
ncbi:MAG: hypothetical protein ACREMA_09505 [Longimicrobiales bacterium]